MSKVSEILIPQSRWILTKLNLKLQRLVAQSIRISETSVQMYINEIKPKTADTSEQSTRNSDTSVQMNINQIKPKIADTSSSKYQNFWYLSPDEYWPN